MVCGLFSSTTLAIRRGSGKGFNNIFISCVFLGHPIIALKFNSNLLNKFLINCDNWLRNEITNQFLNKIVL